MFVAVVGDPDRASADCAQAVLQTHVIAITAVNLIQPGFKIAARFRARVKERSKGSTLELFDRRGPLRHLLRERTLRAIGIVLHAKIFVDLQ